MASQEFKELTGKNRKELQAMLAEGRGKLQEMQYRASLGQLKNAHERRAVRRQIARLSTALTAQKTTI